MLCGLLNNSSTTDDYRDAVNGRESQTIENARGQFRLLFFPTSHPLRSIALIKAVNDETRLRVFVRRGIAKNNLGIAVTAALRIATTC
jgi:hypothetical protein